MWARRGDALRVDRCSCSTTPTATPRSSSWTRWNPRPSSHVGACPFRLQRSFATRQAAAVAAEELGFPVVVKSRWASPTRPKPGSHARTSATRDEVSAAVAEMSNLSESFLIEKMVEGVVAELIVGVARDDQFGPYLLVGGGGILVEMMKDSRSLLLPVNRERGV